jgi:6-phosphogluconolactonase
MEALMTERHLTKIHVLLDLEAISHEAASLSVALAKKSIGERGRFVTALSGGSTPRKLYDLLASEPYRGQVDWERVHVFWADERCVPPDHMESNFRLAFDRVLSKVPLPKENIHRIRGEVPPEEGAQDYEKNLRQFFGTGFPVLDLIILGMGEDGHTASLFPGSESIEETERLVVPVYLDKSKWARITLTFPVLNHARQIVFLVSGRAKAAVLSEVLGNEDQREKYPAGLIEPVHGQLTWLIDEEAASLMRKPATCQQ